ncbi:MAG: MMPL family transporter [Planctomycetota bacterium]
MAVPLNSKSKAEFFSRVSLVSVLTLLLALPFLGYWAVQLRFGTTFVEAWLPGDDAARATYREFREQFGEDQYLILSWPSCNLKDARLEVFADRLRELASTRPELKITEVSDSNQSYRVLAQALQGDFRKEAERTLEVTNRLAGISIGKKGEGFITLALSQAPTEARAELLEVIRREAGSILGEEADELIVAGEPFQIHVIDQSSRKTMERMVPPSSILALIVAWACLRNLRLTLLVFAFAGLGQLAGMAAVSFFIGEMAAVLVVIPTLVFMLTLSASVHLTSYFKDAGAERNHHAGVIALFRGGKPCLLASVTTAIGFASLMASQLSPVWLFGSLSAGSLLLVTIWALLCFPVVSRFIVSFGRSKESQSEIAESEQRNLDDESEKLELKPLSGLARILGNLTHRFSVPISVLGVLILIASCLGLYRLKSSTEFEDMFIPGSEAVQSLNWVRSRLGPLDSLEFLVRIESSEEPNRGLQELHAIRKLHKAIDADTNVDSTFSVSTFFPSLPSGKGTRDTIKRAVFRKKLESKLGEFEERGLLHREAEANVWRITARVHNIRRDSYPEIVAALEARVDRALVGLGNGGSVSYHITGLRSIVEKAHYALISDLATSFATAFLLITPIMMVIARGIWQGALLMIPNVLPVGLVFGLMGWAGVQLDVASILTASVALGIAVDDTLHFLICFMRTRRAGASQAEAVNRAIHVCARPMLQTTLICSAAMSPFFFSEFLPTSKFALLMILILSGAIVGDLLLLPAILHSPLGRRIGAAKTQS